MILVNGCTASRTDLLVREDTYIRPTRAGGYSYPTNTCGRILISDQHVREDTYIRPLRFLKTFNNDSRGFEKPPRWFGETNGTTNRAGGYLYPTPKVSQNL
ncbi:MAG: hypothetical protein LCH91_25840 [Bacteroidetes bacterium]|nr:hypothetical protein [Bacteroidota bacterium]